MKIHSEFTWLHWLQFQAPWASQHTIPEPQDNKQYEHLRGLERERQCGHLRGYCLPCLSLTKSRSNLEMLGHSYLKMLVKVIKWVVAS